MAMEQRIVMAGFDIKSFNTSIHQDEPLLKNLHRTNKNLTWVDCAKNFERNLRESSQEVIELCEAAREGLGLRTMSRRCRTRIGEEIRSSVNSCTNRQCHARRLQEKAKVHISTVSEVIKLESRAFLYE